MGALEREQTTRNSKTSKSIFDLLNQPGIEATRTNIE